MRFNHPAAPAIASALAALIVFAITLGGTFIYDDFAVFNDDARLRHPDQWWKYWTDSYNGGVDNLYRPLTSMTYALQWRLHGDEVKWPYHAVNWLLHAAVAALVAELTRRLLIVSPSSSTLGEGRGEGLHGVAGLAPIVAGLLFAVHPIHVEAVANVIGRAELLAALGVLGGMILFLHRPLTIARAFAIFACLLLAALSKEQGLLLPFLLFIAAVCLRIKPTNARERRAFMTLTILLTWSLATMFLLRESKLALNLKFEWDRTLLDWTINPIIRSTGADGWLMPIAILGRYFRLLIAPTALSIDYGGTVIGSTIHSTDPYLYLGFFAIAACGFACVHAWKTRSRALMTCIGAFILTFGLISNFILIIGTNFGERLMYLPSAFVLIYIAILAARYFSRRAITVTLTIAVALGAFKSFDYARRWNDRVSFYEWSITQQPKSVRLRMLLVAELMSQQRLDDAKAVASDARKLLPEYNEVWIQSADVALAQNDLDAAEEFLHRAMELRGSNKAAGRLLKIGEKRAAAATQP